MGLDQQSNNHLFYIQFQLGFFNRQLWRARRREERIRAKWKLVKLGDYQQRYFRSISPFHACGDICRRPVQFFLDSLA